MAWMTSCLSSASSSPHDFKEVAGSIRADRQDSGRVGVRLEIGDDDGVREGVVDRVVLDAVLVCRTVDLHTPIS
jgi:hypothetical protein